MVHELKCWCEYFDAVANGMKPFEVRCDDRDYQIGDILHLKEYSKHTEAYTGAEIKRLVTYTLRGKPFVPEGYVIMGLQEVKE